MHSTNDYYVHPSAIVDEGCQIGQGSKIWHFCHIMKGAQIGNDVIVGQNAFVADGVVIGDMCKIQNNVSLYTGVILEDAVFVGPSAVFTNVINPRATIERKDEYRTTRVKIGATIGANATIVCGSTIGAYAMIGAGTVVTHDVPDYALVVGNPGRQIGWRSRAGMPLHFVEDIASCSLTGEHYLLTDGHVSLYSVIA